MTRNDFLAYVLVVSLFGGIWMAGQSAVNFVAERKAEAALAKLSNDARMMADCANDERYYLMGAKSDPIRFNLMTRGGWSNGECAILLSRVTSSVLSERRELRKAVIGHGFWSKELSPFTIVTQGASQSAAWSVFMSASASVIGTVSQHVY